MDIEMKNYIAGSDFGEVYRIFTDFDTNLLIIDKPDHNSMGAFTKWMDEKLQHDFNDFMVFKCGEQFLGFAYSYDFQPLNGHCLFSLAVSSPYRKKGIGGLIALKFLSYLFDNYNLRKVYIHIYGNNLDSILCAEEYGFVLEGTLKEYRFCNGVFNDVLVYSISRNAYNKKLSELSAQKCRN